MSHEKAAKRVVRCLKGTLDEGIIMKPYRLQGLTCYVDADFAGNWTPEQALDPRACLSRTGFVIFCANCPIAWHSKLQTTIPQTLWGQLSRMLMFQVDGSTNSRQWPMRHRHYSRQVYFICWLFTASSDIDVIILALWK